MGVILMRFIVTILGFMVFATTSHAAPPTLAQTAKAPTKISAKGNFRFRIFGRNEVIDYYDPERVKMELRVRPGLAFDPTTEITMYVEPQFSKIYGSSEYVPSSETANTLTPTSGAGYDPAYSLHQGYIDWHPADFFNLIVGRQELAYGSHRVLGNSEWGSTGRSFDAAKFRLGYSSGDTEFFFSKLNNNVTVDDIADDKDLAGMYNSWKIGPIRDFDLYLLYQRSGAVFPNKHLWAIGLRLASEVEMVDYDVELTKEGGPLTPSAAHQFDFGLGLNGGGGQFKARFGFGGFVAGKGYDQLYPTTHKFLGDADVFGRRNIFGFKSDLGIGYSDTFTFKLGYHYFARAYKEAPAYAIDGATPIGIADGSRARALGNEIDLSMLVQGSDYVFVGLGVALLFPGQYLVDQFGTDRPYQYYTQMTVKF